MPTSKRRRKDKNRHRGGTFDSFLREEGLLEEVHAAALKRALALELADLMKKKQVRKSTMASKMKTSRAAVHRLLDPTNTSVTLVTLSRAAKALGRRVEIKLVAA